MTWQLETLKPLKGFAKNRYLKDSGFDEGDYGDSGQDGGGYDGYTYEADGSGSYTDPNTGETFSWDAEGEIGTSYGDDSSLAASDGYTYNEDGSGSYTDPSTGETVAWDADGNIDEVSGYHYFQDGSGVYIDPATGETVSWGANGEIIDTSSGEMGPTDKELGAGGFWSGLLDLFGGDKGPAGSGKGSSFLSPSNPKPNPTTPKTTTKTPTAAQKAAAARAAAAARSGSSGTILGMPTGTVLLLGAAGAALYLITKKGKK